MHDDTRIVVTDSTIESPDSIASWRIESDKAHHTSAGD